MVESFLESLRAFVRWALIPFLIGVVVVGWSMRDSWLPIVSGWFEGIIRSDPAKKADGNDDHDHEHKNNGSTDSIDLSSQARSNVGLTLSTVKLTPFDRSVSVPGIIVEIPGRSKVDLTTPVTGVVTAIYAVEGQSVQSGERLFDIRLTHEEVVQAQVEVLRISEEIDVVKREIARIEGAVKEGAIPGKTLIERNYELQLKEAARRAGLQSLVLHGLTPALADGIARSRQLLTHISIYAPAANENSSARAQFQIKRLSAERGMYVPAGAALAELADHSELYIEGSAFEQDGAALQRAAANGTEATASIDIQGSRSEAISGLKILYVSGDVEADSRTTHFYMHLQNEGLESSGRSDGKRFPMWRYRPGQRVQIQIPIERWNDRIVLPAEAVAEDGAEFYVFLQNGAKGFVRRSVHVEFRNPSQVVIANDGSIFPGDVVAVSGVQQLQYALKNKSGGGIDPHAGHNH